MKKYRYYILLNAVGYCEIIPKNRLMESELGMDEEIKGKIA